MMQIGLPHSEIPGSKVAHHLPEAYRRHAASFIASSSQGIHHTPLFALPPDWVKGSARTCCQIFRIRFSNYRRTGVAVSPDAGFHSASTESDAASALLALKKAASCGPRGRRKLEISRYIPEGP